MRLFFTLFFSSLFLISCSDNDDINLQTLNTPQKTSTKKITVSEKKQHFRNLLEPAVNKAYQQLQQQYLKAKKDIANHPDSDFIKNLKKSYKVESNEDLLMALKPHPRSIVMAQAALESGWATSRIFKVANNVFGVWSFNENEPRIPALKKRGNKTIYLKKYDSIEDSVLDNYKVLATGRAFKDFRILKMQTDNPFELVKKLDKYSEKGDKYGKELAAMIRFNKFDRLDQQP